MTIKDCLMLYLKTDVILSVGVFESLKISNQKIMK